MHIILWKVVKRKNGKKNAVNSQQNTNCHTLSLTHTHAHTTIVAPANPATYSPPPQPPLPPIQLTLTITLVLLGGPVHALAVREGGDVGVGVDAQGQVAAPHAAVLRAAAAAAVLCARPLAAHCLPLRLVGGHVAGCSHWKNEVHVCRQAGTHTHTHTSTVNEGNQ